MVSHESYITIRYEHALVHLIVAQRVDGTPEGRDVLRVHTGCRIRMTFHEDPRVGREMITCVPCLARWLTYPVDAMLPTAFPTMTDLVSENVPAKQRWP